MAPQREPVGSLLEKWSADWTLAGSVMKRFSKSKDSVRLYKLLSARWIFGVLVLYFFQNLAILSLVLSPPVFCFFLCQIRGPTTRLISEFTLCYHSTHGKNYSNF